MIKNITFDLRRVTFNKGRSLLYRNSRLVYPPSIMAVRLFSDYPDYIPLEMPALSPTMERGSIAEWVKQEGDKIEVGEVMAEVETDKATVAWESVEEGYLAKIILPDGSSDIEVGTLAGIFVEEEEEIAAFKDFVDDSVATPTPVPASEPSTTTSPKPAAIPVAPVAVPTSVATPAPVAAPAAQIAPVTTDAHGEHNDLSHTNIRKVIADRLTQSKQQIPHYYLTLNIQMDKVGELRKELNARQEKTKISINDFIIKASSLALRDVPEANSSWFDDVVRQYNYVDICVAVATDEGLITPIIKNADQKGLGAISSDVQSLASKARENKLQPHEYQGGTFTISNLGMFGVKSFTAIINPPQACILAVGTTVEKVIVNENTGDDENPYTSASFMSVTLSCDHRVIDGAVGAGWLASFKGYMENPRTMLL